MKHFFLISYILLLAPALASGQSPEVGSKGAKGKTGQETLRIATWDSAPFAFKESDGKWTGISIDLWEAIAQELDQKYEYREYDFQGALDAVEGEQVDIGVAPFTVTPDRFRKMSFSRSYMMTGFGIATTTAEDGHFATLLRQIVNWEFFRTLSILFLTLVLIGGLVWFFERKNNHDQFGRRPLEGLISGFWWSAVTMTTVGYGDKSPVTLGGRIIGLFWMFLSIIIISALTGSIAAELTVFRMSPKVSGPQDLRRVVVGTVASSVQATYLDDEGITSRKYESITKGLEGLAEGSISAFVADHSMLSYSVAKDFPGKIEILPQTFEPNFIAFPMALEPEQSQRINLKLLELLERPEWRSILKKYNVNP